MHIKNGIVYLSNRTVKRVTKQHISHVNHVAHKYIKTRFIKPCIWNKYPNGYTELLIMTAKQWLDAYSNSKYAEVITAFLINQSDRLFLNKRK